MRNSTIDITLAIAISCGYWNRDTKASTPENSRD